MADDLGIGDLSCYGQQQFRTPNIDRLAQEGLRFTDAYAGCTVCAPSRSVLMTGLHMGHTSIRSNPGGAPLISTDVTVAQVLKNTGYATGLFGKWGLGDVGTEGVPSKKGFDESYGYLHQVHAHYFYPRFLYHNEKQVPLTGNGDGRRVTYSHDAITEKALAFIERNRSRPFFCYVPFTIPHLELLVPEDSVAKYRGKFPERAYLDPRKHYADQPEVRATYAGMVDRLDRDVGRITSLIGKLGLDNDTIVFFTSDNGAATPLFSEHHFNSTAGLRGHKQNLYEGGIRAPMIARWKGAIAAGRTSAHTWYFADFLPTAAELASAKAPGGLDGISIMPTLVGEKRAGRSQQQHEYLYWELPRHDAKTGLFRNETPMQALRMGEWKAVRPKPDGALELYHLPSDPAESKNVAAAQPRVMKRVETILASARTEPRVQREPEDGWYGKRETA